MQTMLLVLLEATGSLDDKPTITKVVALLSTYSHSNPDKSHGVQEAAASLSRLWEKLPPDDAEKPHLLPNNKPRRFVDSSGSVRRYSLPGSHLQCLT
jgi:hypothetical protein